MYSSDVGRGFPDAPQMQVVRYTPFVGRDVFIAPQENKGEIADQVRNDGDFVGAIIKCLRVGCYQPLRFADNNIYAARRGRRALP